MQDKVIEAKSQHQSIAGHPVFVWIHPRDTANISHKPEEPWLIQWFSFSRQDGTAIRIWENTPRWADCRSADDEVTIKCAYRRNCCILDNDNYKDISRKASLSLLSYLVLLQSQKRSNAASSRTVALLLYFRRQKPVHLRRTGISSWETARFASGTISAGTESIWGTSLTPRSLVTAQWVFVA